MEAQKNSTISSELTVRLTVNNPTPTSSMLSRFQFGIPTLSYSLIPLIVYVLLILIQSLFTEKIATTGIVMALKRLRISLSTIRLVAISFSLFLSITLLLISGNLAEIIYVIISLSLLLYELYKKQKAVK